LSINRGDDIRPNGAAARTSAGSVEPGMLLWLIEHGGLSPADVREGLSQRSGLLGLSGGRTGDSRDLVAAVEGDADAALALAVVAHRGRRELAAAATSLPTLDALVFTGEIGWGQPEVRRQLTDGLAILGTDHRVLVVEPHAEREIARLTAATLHSP
jgi:acetate kinase